jgi:transposase
LTSKIHAVVDGNGLPVRLALSPGEAHDVRLAGKLLSRLKSGSMLLPTVAMTRTGSGSLPRRRARGPTSRRKATAAIRSASAPISTALATGSSGSLTGSNNVVGWRRAMTGLLPTTLPSFNSRQSGCGCALMSPRPNPRPLSQGRQPRPRRCVRARGNRANARLCANPTTLSGVRFAPFSDIRARSAVPRSGHCVG